jgi:3-oxoacyl-[acyl-carrier-protein] synthase-3
MSAAAIAPLLPHAAPWRSRGAISVWGTGAALPGPPVSTAELIGLLTARFDFQHGAFALALAERMGISSRHLSRGFAARAEPPLAGRSNPELGAEAVRHALADAGLAIGEIGYLIAHTATPAQPLPPNVALMADALGYAGPYIELRQACSGFANALMIAFGQLAVPDARPIVIVGSETGSVFFDPHRADADAGQRVNLVQMGDGAGAIVLGPDGGDDRITAAWFGTRGLGITPGLQMRGGGSNDVASTRHLEFDHDFAEIARTGADLFKACAAAASDVGAPLDGVEHIIPHQVSGRIGSQIADHFGIPVDRVVVDANHHGNTGSAAIWLSFAGLRARGLASGARAVALGAEATKFMYGGFVYEHG